MTTFTMRYIKPFRCDRPRCAADAVQVACRSQGLVQGALSWLAAQGERSQAYCIQISGYDLVT